MDVKLIHQIEEQIGLTFYENESEGNLCFLENQSEMKNEFKSGFTLSDFRYFIGSFSDGKVEIPNDAEEFWERVAMGKLK